TLGCSALLYLCLLFVRSDDRRDLHSFPTRRSSDLFIPGGLVRKGDLLLKIDPSDYQIQLELRKSELLQAQSDLMVEQGRQYIAIDRKSTRLNSSHVKISYAVFCLKKKILTCRYTNI